MATAVTPRRPSGPLIVVGDALLDRDVDGSVGRLCPDAPVPVLDEESTVDRPGGAGLAAALAARSGREVVLITALADDAGGARLCQLLDAAGVSVYAARLSGATTEKIRLRVGDRVLLRLDRGGGGEPGAEAPTAALDALRDAAAILVSDYGRGVARSPGVREALGGAAAPLVWDPHPRGPAAVPGARLITPNEAELRELTDVRGDGPRLAPIARGADDLRHRWRAGAVVVTLGRDGALLCHAGPTPLVVPAPDRVDGDTCGAGDAFASAAALALADGALVSEAVQSAVVEAGRYVRAGGAAGWSAAAAMPTEATDLCIGAAAAGALVADVRAHGGTVVATGGCFDLLHAGHLATLRAARRLGDCLVVCLNSDASVTALKGPDRPLVRQADRARLLAALDCVDAVVVFDEPTPSAVLNWLRPDIWVKGGDYSDGTDLPEAGLVRRWGGQTVIVPYLAGRSTTSMIAAARNGTREKGA
ncbi:MAG TPA: PfkB family carbohydrate kinase [Micromonosporaceae bacterium]|jgi:rfaE bifunctional protein nucleotidyltransferase chain/domain/rfaE bifunctional protein kinase chain/domain